MPHRKGRQKNDDPEIQALHERAELVRRRSEELIRQMEALAGEIARANERAQDGHPAPRKPPSGGR
jgi:hypothetical protein